MHFLITRTGNGDKLVDYSESFLGLRSQMNQAQAMANGEIMILFSEDKIRDTYLCDDFGIPIEEEGFLIRMEDL